MSVKPKSLVVYQSANGKQPYTDWFRSLKDKQTQAIILKRLNRLRQGNLGDYKSLKDGLFELRIDYGPGYRIYFAQEADQLVILLLCAGQKSSQENDIKAARKYLMDYRSHHE